ncbi:unnamed protein product, partial [Iphiclides podalirius]
MSVLAYQEVTRRIEELTRCIYELDPFVGGGDEAAATLGLLLEAGERARAERRPRSPHPPRATPTPGTTYAEIVKGFSSRSSSVGSRQPSAQRVPHEPAHDWPRHPTPAEEESDPSETCALVPSVGSEMANEPSSGGPLSEAVDDVSESDANTPDPIVHHAPYLEENIDRTHLSTEFQEDSGVQSSDFATSMKNVHQDLSHAELRPPEYHDRSLSPASRLRSQDLSYAEILALGLRKQANSQNTIALPKPQVAEVEMVKEIVVEVEKAPSLIKQEPRTDSSRLKTHRPERPFQRSRSRDMPRQRRAPEKRPTKSYDLQIIKKKKPTKKVIEVENFDDSTELQVLETTDTSTIASSSIKKVDEPKLEKPGKEITKKVQHSATVIETVAEKVTDGEENYPPKTEVEYKKTKKKNKHKKLKESDDEIEKALKEIEESDRHKKRKIKDNHDKSKEVFKGRRLDESVDKEANKKSLELKENPNKQKKKKFSKDLQTARSSQDNSGRSMGSDQQTSPRNVEQCTKITKQEEILTENEFTKLHSLDTQPLEWSDKSNEFDGNNVKANDVANIPSLPLSKMYEDESKNMKSENEIIRETTNVFIQKEMSTHAATSALCTKTEESSVTCSFDNRKNVNYSKEGIEIETEITSKQKKKRKNKKQSQSAEYDQIKSIKTEAIETVVEENIKLVEPIHKVLKQDDIQTTESYDSVKELLLDTDNHDEDINDTIHSKKKTNPKDLDSNENDKPIEHRISQNLPVEKVSEDKKNLENLQEEQFTEVKGHKKSKKSKNVDDEKEKILKSTEHVSKNKSKEKIVKSIDKVQNTSFVNINDNEASGSQEEFKASNDKEKNLDYYNKVHNYLVTMDWNTLMAEEESIVESELSPISQPTCETETCQTNIQVATEVTILPEIIDLSSIKTKNEEFIHCQQVSEGNQNAKDDTADSEEQNNNDKLENSPKGSSFNIVEEITRYEPIMEDVETRTIYLITHEEKKLPPIRTVKIFSSKSNSLDNESQLEITPNKIIDDHVDTPVNVDNILEEELIGNDLIKERCEQTDDSDSNVMSKKHSLNVSDDNFASEESIKNVLKSEHVTVEFEKDKINPTEDIKNEENLTDTLNKENEDSVSLETVCHNIVNISPHVEEFTDTLLEHAIFGSVQDRKRAAPSRSHTIPYQELIEDIKTYSFNIDVDKMDYDYHQIMDEDFTTTEDTIKAEDQEVSSQNNDGIVQQVLANVYEEVIDEESSLSTFPKVEVPNRHLNEIIEDKNLMLTVSESESVKARHKNEYPIHDVEVVLAENPISEGQSEIYNFVTDNKQLEMFPTTYLEIIIGAQDHNSDIEKLKQTPEFNDNGSAAGTFEKSFNTDEIDVITEKVEYEKPESLENQADLKSEKRVEALASDIPRFNYQEIADSEKYFAMNVHYPVDFVNEIDRLVCNKTIENKIDQHAIDVDNSFSTQKQMDEFNFEDDLSTSNTQEELVKRMEMEQTIAQSLRQEAFYNYYDISDAEKGYHSLNKAQSNQSDVLSVANMSQNTTTEFNEESIKTEERLKYTESLNTPLQQNRLSDTDVLLFEVPKYNLHEINSAEILLGSKITLQEGDNKKTVVFEEDPRNNSDGILCPERTDTALNSQASLGNIVCDKMEVQNYYEIKDAENVFAYYLSKSGLESLDATIHLPDTNNKDKLSNAPTESLSTSISKIEEIGNEIKREFNENLINDSLQGINKSENVIYEALNHNYMELCEAERILGRISTNFSLPVPTEESKENLGEGTKEADDKYLLSAGDVHQFAHNLCPRDTCDTSDKPNDGEILDSEINVLDETTNRQFEIPVEPETTSSLIPIVFGDITEVTQFALERDALKKEEHTKNDPVQVETAEQVENEDVMDDFVVIEDMDEIEVPYIEKKNEKFDSQVLNTDKNIMEDLDFEHSFEVIEIEKDISIAINSPIDEKGEKISEEEFPHSSLHGIQNSENIDVSSKEIVLETQEDIVKNQKDALSESSEPPTLPETISAELIEPEISSSSCTNTFNVDDTLGHPSNATSTDSYINLDSTNLASDFKPNESTLPDKKTINRLEKSPIHSLHDLLPEIDSIPEFKPSFSTTVLNSKLSADAPEFTPSYMYQTPDPMPKCVIVDTEKLLFSDKQDSLQKDEQEVKPLTYSSILTTKKEKILPDDVSKDDESHGMDMACNLAASNQESIDTKTKRSKKKKKKEDKKERPETPVMLGEMDLSNVSISDDRQEQSDTSCTENVWIKEADDGKSYAKVLAAGLTDSECKESILPNVQDTDVIISSDPPRTDDDVSQNKDNDSLDTLEEAGSYEVVGSWAKIVASNRPSPERTQKNVVHTVEPVHTTTRAPIILVDDSDSEHHKPEIEVDAEGFIKVDRNRRSRSRSRDNRSASISNTEPKIKVREKSENRFIALTSTLKPDDGDSIQSSHSNDEKDEEKNNQEMKDQAKRGRKSRVSKSKEKEMKPKAVLIAPSTSDEEKQPVKKDKRKRSSKSKEKIISKPLATESIETLQEIKEVQPESLKQEAPIQLSHDIEVENKRKTKKKKKEKKVIMTTETPSSFENTSSEQEYIKSNTPITSIKCLETPISTPESLETPIKDRVYSEAQYWKIDPSLIDISNSPEILTVEIDENCLNKYENIVFKVEQSPQNNDSIEINNTIIQNLHNILNEKEGNVSPAAENSVKIQEQRIFDEQSLENKMADLQREIEEMLLPENEASIASDDTPQELVDTHASLDDQHDETFENITPCLASPEPEDITQTDSTVLKETVFALKGVENKILNPNTDLDVPEVTSVKDIKIDQKLDTEQFKGVDSLTTNISPKAITNNFINIKLDTFWFEKAATDDAEKLLVEQNISNSDTFEPPLVQECQSVVTFMESTPLHDNIPKNLIKDTTFWPEKHLYHDAECDYFFRLANSAKQQVMANIEIEITDKKDKDKDPGGGSGHSSEMDEPPESSGSPFDSNYISMDLPGGICSWKDHSSYLSLETPCDSLIGQLSEDTPRVGIDMPEDKLTNPSLEPVAFLPPEQEPAPEESGNRTTAKDELSNNLETLLEEVRIVQAQLSDLPNETLDAMEAGLVEGIAVLVKCEEAAILLEQKIMEYDYETEVQVLLKELIIMKTRIAKLLTQARQGLQTIKDARVEIEHQSKQLEEQKKQLTKVDTWLDVINTELNETTKQGNVLTEEDIVKYIEIYERYVREYEEYEIILNSITVIGHDESSQSTLIKLNALRRALEKSKYLVISEIERLRKILINIKFTPEVVEEEISQSDRTIDSTSMPEEIVSPRETQVIEETPIEKSSPIIFVPESDTSFETEHEMKTKIDEVYDEKIKECKKTVAVDTQTGKSLMSDNPSLHDKSVICVPEVKETHDVSLTCAPPQDVDVQTSERKSPDRELFENIQVKQTVSDGHETIIISSRPVVREEPANETSLLVGADYKDDNSRKNSELNITHSIPQSFETVMVEPDETTTEIVVDADGTRRIIVKKIRRTFVTRQQMVQSSEEGIPHEQSYQQITLKKDGGSASTILGDGALQNVQYQTYEGQVISGLPGREMTVQEFTSKPEMILNVEKDMSPEQILQLAEGEMQPHVQTSSSVTAVVEQITKRIIKTKRRIIRRVVIIDGKEHTTDEIIEEPDDVEVFEEQIPRVSISVKERSIPTEKSDSDDDDKKQPFCADEIKEQVVKDEEQGSRHSKSNDISENDEVSPKSTVYDDEERKITSQLFIKNNKPEETHLEPVQNVIQQLDSQGENILSPTGEEITQLESSSSHCSTVTKTVTRKITRTRKRIIKHIQIIDGKEHVTEEVIEEPDDIEIIEEDPVITHTSTGEDIKMNKVKLLRQVQIVDGKEYVTEKVIEEGDEMNTNDPVTIIDPNIEERTIEKHEPIKISSSQTIDTDESQTDLTSNMIRHEIDYNVMSKSPIQKEETQPKIELFNESFAKPEKKNDNEDKLEEKQKTLTDLVDRDIQKEIGSNDNELVTDYNIISVPCISNEGINTLRNRTTSEITRKRIIKHIEIVDGKEHITEEIIEEPVEVETILTEPTTFTLQEEGIKTKHLKIIRNVQIIDGKENVTEQIVENSGDEYIPDSTIKAEIDVKISELPHPFKESEVHEEKYGRKESVDNLLNTDLQQMRTAIDVSKGFIEDQIRHSLVLHDSSCTNDALEEEKAITFPIQTNAGEEIVDQFNTKSKNLSVELAHIISSGEEAPSISGGYEEIPEKVETNKTPPASRETDPHKAEEQTPSMVTEKLISAKDGNAFTGPKLEKPFMQQSEKDTEEGIDKNARSTETVSEAKVSLADVVFDKPAEYPTVLEHVAISDNLPLSSIAKNENERQKNVSIEVTKTLLSSEIDQATLPQTHSNTVEEMGIKCEKEHIDSDLQKSSLFESTPPMNMTTQIIISESKNLPTNVENILTSQDPVKHEEPQSEEYKNVVNANAAKDISLLEATKSFIGFEVEHSFVSQDIIKKQQAEPNKNISIYDSSHLKDETEVAKGIEDKEDKGYEAEDVSLCPTPLPDKKKRHKKRKAQVLSEDTTYPKWSATTEDETLMSTPTESDDIVRNLKEHVVEKEEQKLTLEQTSEELGAKPIIKTELSKEVTTSSPIEESYHTISEGSDVSTVKIIEECVTRTPEMAQNDIATTITYTVPVVEEIITQEYSVQTSPDIVTEQVDSEVKYKKPAVETTDSELQTSPKPIDNIFVQTLPKEEKEECTQTILATVDVQDSQIQTNRIDTPDVVLQTEATTQVVSDDITYLEEKCSQTSPINDQQKVTEEEILPVVMESRDIQTSPMLQVQDKKSDEFNIETKDTDIQTIYPESIDKETSTTPIQMKDVTEISIQTPEISQVSVFTQIEEEHEKNLQNEARVQPDDELNLPQIEIKKQETVTTDVSQQTSPREGEPLPSSMEHLPQDVLKVENSQQTSPRPNTEELGQTEVDQVTAYDKIQQTSPRSDTEENILNINRKSNIVDTMQQTSPRIFSDDSMSTSTDEPYEIHLRAQISIPQVTDDFINNERQIQESPQSIISDKSKQKKRRSKKKTESPLQSPGSLSDPINAELSLSVTPTSDDLSSKETTSIDEGISQIVSPVVPISDQIVTQPKLTYSDVVQRSKSKSPSPSKSITLPRKSEKAKLIDSLEKRTQSVIEPRQNSPTETMAVALIESSMEKSYDLIINKEIDELKKAVENRDPNKIEKSVVVVIETISIWLEEIQYKIQIETVTGNKQKLDELDKVETDNIDNTDMVRKLFRRFRSIVEANPKRECPSKLYTCDEDTKQIENSINTERDRLMQLMSLAEEYEQTLQDFGQITDVAEALLDGKIIVSDLDHLHEEIQKHRKFFVNLSHCRAILESLEDNLDAETRAKFSSLHNSLHDRATKIIDRAAGRAQQMTLAASRWSVLDHGMKEEQQWLRVAHQRVPDLTNVTSIDHEQYINLYQSISLDVSHHYAKMLRLLSITESLQNLIICSALESQCSIALDTLLTLQDDIDSRLTRLRAFKENWMTYEHLINRVESWMNLANRELENITPENITTTVNLRRFWELKAQHEVHHNLKNESGLQFEKALEILPISDEMVQRQFFSKVEEKWHNLASRFSDLHATAIQNISDRDVSSGEKLHILEEEIRELRSSLDGLKGVIKSEDELNLYTERLQVMTGRIDRIQNELGRLSLLPNAESERLGALLTQSGTLNDQIAEELERSLILKEKIVQVQAGIVRCQKNQRRARLTLEECEAAERLGSDVVEQASETCQRLLEDLATQWRDILTLRQALHTLPISLRVCVSPTGIERDISALQETHAEIEAACNDLCARLRAKVQLWKRFERQLELVQGAVREADYMVELLTVQGQVDYDRLLKATEKLETLSESLSRRSGELVGELREAAAPLESTAEPSVAAQLRREMDDAAAAYEHTCRNLTQMCDKYQKAVELWRRYRDAASAVRAFADSQEGRLHALRPDDAPAAKQACLEQESRVAELRSLAAQVAAETGSRALQADADALARRLQLVAGAVQALADLGEARQLARAKAQHAKEKLCDMRQDLAPVHEDGEIVEDKLIALRDNLIALGKSEADIAPAKAELPDIDRDVSEEHSIVRILELWQAMFRDTFLHYHRLSTALVRSGDAATALKLWHEYLLDLQSFLSGSLPTDYENLTEHRRLCRVHRNLLASQRSVLINENKETTNRDLADKFDTLTNLHNETLARIVERHDEVCTRIAAWDDYREIYTELLRWLKEIEREKEKLQLRYVHIKRIHKILTKIQNLFDKLPEGRKFAEKLSVYLKRVLAFTEETYGASVRMEYAGIVKRVDNLQASLDTWRDFLTRILGLIGEYENLTGDLHKLYSRTQDEVMSYSDEERLSRPQLKKAIEKYSELRKKIDKTETQIEALSVIQEQLKECLSPQDIRIVNQRVWQMRQQRADLEHQLSIIIHRLQERLEVYTIFDSRLSRFFEWMTTLETRLETSSSSSEASAMDPHDLIRRINSDIQAETALKEREFEWLAETGSSLVDLSKKDEKNYSKNTSKQLKDVQERWQRLQETGRSRIAKINELLETISQLEERLTEIRMKLHTIESKLSTSVVIENLTAKAVDEKFQDRDEIHKSIEDESGEVGETLNLCELVFNDTDVLKGNFDLRNLRTGVEIVEKKWKNICEMSEQRKGALKEIRKSAELANSLLPKAEKRLDSIERRVEKVEIRKQRGDTDDDSVSKAVIKDLDAMEEDVARLEEAYSRIASARGVELRGEGADHAARLRTAVRRWRQLRGRVDAAGADLQRQFVAAHGRAVVALAEVDVRLTRALHLAPTPPDQAAAFEELDGVERELRECEALVAEADRLEAMLGGAGGSATLAAEYRALLQDVAARLQLAKAAVVGDVDSAVQVDTLKWETDASLQVDTLTSKETYRSELAAAVGETSDALEALGAALLPELEDDAGGEELAAAAKEIAKAGARPGQTLELAKHLSELLLTECDATEEEAMLREVEALTLRYEDLLAQAKKRELRITNLRLPHSASYALTCEHESGRLSCPLCSDRNWKQLDNDLWRLEQWLQFAEATDEARTEPPEQYDALEDAIQDHREFLLDLDSHKALVVSLNVVGAHVARHARSAAAGERARARLAAANARWDRACARAGHWQARLQHALLHNRQFHDIVVELVAQLSDAERCVRAREPLRLRRPADELRRDFRRFSELRDELAAAEPRVQALRDAAALLQGLDSQHVCRRLGELRLRLQSLRKLSAVYALKLGASLAQHPAGASAVAAAAACVAPQLLDEEEEQISSLNLPPLDASEAASDEGEEGEERAVGRVRRGVRFVCRVARASLPFQALLLLLLGAAALAPHAHSDCRAPHHGLEPVLRYPDGPPPISPADFHRGDYHGLHVLKHSSTRRETAASVAESGPLGLDEYGRARTSTPPHVTHRYCIQRGFDDTRASDAFATEAAELGSARMRAASGRTAPSGPRWRNAPAAGRLDIPLRRRWAGRGRPSRSRCK